MKRIDHKFSKETFKCKICGKSLSTIIKSFSADKLILGEYINTLSDTIDFVLTHDKCITEDEYIIKQILE